LKTEATNWIICNQCNGEGKIRKKLSRKQTTNYNFTCELLKINNPDAPLPQPPQGHIDGCSNCNGAGLLNNTQNNISPPNYNLPNVAIIGGGIGGIALAVACLHRGIPFTLYERDSSFNARAQGYGLTLQQASKAMNGLGITRLKDGVNSTRHLVHTTNGNVIGEWGMRKWMPADTKTTPKRINIHIARQALRLALLEQLGGHNAVQWGHQLIDFKKNDAETINLSFEVDGTIKHATANIVVGADGIRSKVRNIIIGEELTPLRYLGCVVILGICPLTALNGIDSNLLDGATVFQTANGNERIYIMPYNADSVMWQLSYPMPENDAKALSALGAKALKTEACNKTQWHVPIPQIVAATSEALISGYPVYDRELLDPALLQKWSNVTLIGDAAHPMSPFKGQGANQALLDALALARIIARECNSTAFQYKEHGIRQCILNKFEAEMLTRSATKVKDSAEAAQFLHSSVVLHEGDMPRGHFVKEI
jgi:2-polyprenyl-6-methoxyphenol hydroxylase-like FAD-dependent oxidoreductase